MKTMKGMMTLAAIMVTAGVTLAQEYKIPVENTRQGVLTLEGFNGNLPIEGYPGKEITIYGTEEVSKVPERAKGLKPVYTNGTDNTGLGLNIEKNGNLVTVRCLLPFTKNANFRFKIPDNFSVKVGAGRAVPPPRPSFRTNFRFEDADEPDVFGNSEFFKDTLNKKDLKASIKSSVKIDTFFKRKGNNVLPYTHKYAFFNEKGGANVMLNDVSIINMKNEIEINSLHSIHLKNVTGPLVLSTVSGVIEVVFTDLNKEKPSSITSVSGEIDITLPPKSAIDLNMSTVSGTIYSDFDFSASGKNMRQIGGSSTHYELNGGGVGFNIATVSGNVYLRKGK